MNSDDKHVDGGGGVQYSPRAAGGRIYSTNKQVEKQTTQQLNLCAQLQQHQQPQQ